VNTSEYVLGSDQAEIARLQTQASMVAEPTALLLERGGVRPGMRVLDLGSGPGDVAFQVAQMVGLDGFVIGVERDPAQLATAQQRLAQSGGRNVVFRNGDARPFTDDEPFDAIVCRLLLMHLPDAVDVLAHHIRNLRPGGCSSPSTTTWAGLARASRGGAVLAHPGVAAVGVRACPCRSVCGAALSRDVRSGGLRGRERARPTGVLAAQPSPTWSVSCER